MGIFENYLITTAMFLQAFLPVAIFFGVITFLLSRFKFVWKRQRYIVYTWIFTAVILSAMSQGNAPKNSADNRATQTEQLIRDSGDKAEPPILENRVRKNDMTKEERDRHTNKLIEWRNK